MLGAIKSPRGLGVKDNSGLQGTAGGRPLAAWTLPSVPLCPLACRLPLGLFEGSQAFGFGAGAALDDCLGQAHVAWHGDFEI